MLDEGYLLRDAWAREASWGIILAPLYMETRVLVVSLQDPWQEHSEGGKEDISKMGKSAFGGFHGQEHSAASFVDSSGSLLCDGLCKLRELLAKG